MKKLVFGLLASAFSLGVVAQEAEEARFLATTRTISLASETARFGYENHSALSLIQAANLMSGLQLEALDVEVELEGEPIVSRKETTVILNRETLLADAREMAAGDNTLLAMVETIANAPVRKVEGGSKYFTRDIPANGSLKWTYTFSGGVSACAFAKGDGDTDLDMYIYDSYDNQVRADTDNTDTMLCMWTPNYRASYTIKIRNYGSVYNRCDIYIN